MVFFSFLLDWFILSVLAFEFMCNWTILLFWFGFVLTQQRFQVQSQTNATLCRQQCNNKVKIRQLTLNSSISTNLLIVHFIMFPYYSTINKWHLLPFVGVHQNVLNVLLMWAAWSTSVMSSSSWVKRRTDSSNWSTSCRQSTAFFLFPFVFIYLLYRIRYNWPVSFFKGKSRSLLNLIM